MFSWSKRLRDVGAASGRVADEKLVGRPIQKSLEDLRAEVAAIEAELADKKIRDAEALERPTGTYRIVKIARPRGSTAESGYFVQGWTIQSYGYELAYTAERRPGRSFIGSGSLGERWYLETALKFSRHSVTHIEWRDVGSANPHPTFEAAEDWLSKWLRPEVEEVFFDANGARAA